MSFPEYDSCTLCPRRCGVNRNRGERGACGETSALRLSRAALHLWEEPPISGKTGSGTVFFTGCPLSCAFCQNGQISRGKSGLERDEKRLEEIFFELREQGAANINLVTPTHFLPHIKRAIAAAKKRGFDLPFVFNTSGYELAEEISFLRGYIDIFLTDFKYFDSSLARKLSGVPDYFRFTSAALDEMVKILPAPAFDGNGMMRTGVIVRQLVLPLHTKDACRVTEYLYKSYGDSIYISLMNQYTPPATASLPPELSRKLSDREYDRVVDFALSLGVKNAFIQERGTQSESFIPEFDFSGV